jgi:hypothetical protein
MKKPLFGKYLKERTTADGVEFYWYQLSIIELLLFFIVPVLSLYLMGFYLHWEELWGLRILPLSTLAVAIILSIIVLGSILLLFNRKSVLKIENDQIMFKKRPLTSKQWHIQRVEVQGIGNKLESQFYESDTGYYPDIYKIYIYLSNNRKIKLGGFNEEDSKRITEVLTISK